jgi:predicted KAP-like P-loop ATPase
LITTGLAGKHDVEDLETKTDLVNHHLIAAAVVGLIRDDDLSPLTIGVHGDWGSGKSTVVETVRADLAKQDKVALLAFNGWLFQGFEDTKIALMEAIIGELERDARWMEKIKNGPVSCAIESAVHHVSSSKRFFGTATAAP